MKKLAHALCLAALATPASAETKLPDEMPGYWCFTRAHWYPDEKIEPDTMPLVRSNAFNCGNLGGVRFWRRGNKSGFQLGRFEWRADCKISKIERLGNKYRVSADCRADRDIFYTGEDSQKPQHETRIFEIWRAKPGLRWREIEENEYDRSELSCARVSDKLPVEPDGSYLNLRVGPGTEFKVKVKLPAGTDLNLDAVSQDGKWKHVRSAVINEENYSGWVREKFVLDQPCKTSKTNETATPPALKPAVTDEPDSGEPPLPPQPYVHRNYEQWKALGCEIRGPDGQPIGYVQPCPEAQAPQTIVITSDYGGIISEYWKRWKTVAISGDEVEIRGKCYSACTLVIAAVPKDRICFSRYATLGFHVVAQDRSVMPDGRGPPAMEATQWMLDQYPKDIRDWIEIRGGLKKLPYHYDVWTLSAPDLWEMGYRRCRETCLKTGEGGALVECTPELK